MQKYNWNYPTTMWVGENRINDIALACKNLNINKPLLVTDNGLAQSDIVKNTLSILKENGISAALYSNVVGNPTGTNVNEGVDSYKKNNCDGVIAFGGGSGLDVGKAVAFMSGQTLPFGILKMLEIIGQKQIQIKLHQLLLYQQLQELVLKQEEHQ